MKPPAAKADDVKDALNEFIDDDKAAFYPSFFKAGKGEYAEGDRFIGVTVPQQRQVAKTFRELSLAQIRKLLRSPIHEHRLTGLLILVNQFERAKEVDLRESIVDFYVQNLDRVNNWDLVDSTAYKILGEWLVDRDRTELYELSKSGDLWRERVSVVACLALIKQNDFDDILRLAEHFLEHPHDLMHKAVGWMLREAGKRDERVLKAFLRRNSQAMPRTMLRYAIERLPKPERKAWLEGRAI